MIKIGDKLWTQNSRDRREPWRFEVVVGETRMSWLLKRENSLHANWPPPTKVSKSTMQENCGRWGHEQWFTEDGMRAKKFILSCRNLIADRVRGEEDAVVLKQVADLLGMRVGEI